MKIVICPSQDGCLARSRRKPASPMASGGRGVAPDSASRYPLHITDHLVVAEHVSLATNLSHERRVQDGGLLFAAFARDRQRGRPLAIPAVRVLPRTSARFVFLLRGRRHGVRDAGFLHRRWRVLHRRYCELRRRTAVAVAVPGIGPGRNPVSCGICVGFRRAGLPAPRAVIRLLLARLCGFSPSACPGDVRPAWPIVLRGWAIAPANLHALLLGWRGCSSSPSAVR